MRTQTELLEAKRRWDDLEALQKHYAKFGPFLHDVMTELLGFNCTWLQLDIAEYLETGPLYRMIQAQRGQAKTTITAIYSVWRLIHDPRCRILIVSAGDALATEIAGWIIQIINHMPELECLRPNTQEGDRSSVKAFDVNHLLKGPEKSPSVACIGVTSSMQGRRADILIGDDVESSKNSQTATMRERLAHLTKDFTSICANGDIIYLGTPQNNDSVYNSLPQRGFDIRVWTGRYPTPEEIPNYQNFLAPSLLERIRQDPTLQSGGGPTGDRGQPTDPEMLGEEVLIKKEIDQGKAYFQLQHMLDTKLMDEDRYPLKTSKLVVMPIPDIRGPVEVNWTALNANRYHPPQGFPLQDPFYKASGTGEEFGHYVGCHMYVDPAGGGANADETAYAITKFLAGRVFLVAAGGVPGGFSSDSLDALTALVVRYKPRSVAVEKNFGHGAFWNIWQPKLNKALADIQHVCGIEEVFETGQKELRIIDILEPIIGSGRLVVDPKVIEDDWASIARYPAEHRNTYSLFYQLARITRDRKSLIHDDRLDALAGSCRYWAQALAQDSDKISLQIKRENFSRLMKNPLGNGRPLPGAKTKSPNILHKLIHRK